ncbi:MAG: MbtH family NRPS accessory protein [Glaciimonas sp.]|nr:MbtH family NRPS accessory protein [Glaciimonas sp.]
MSFESTDTIFRVVANDEEQYSIWPDDKDMPKGWREVGFSGNKQSCLTHIEQMWVDMRPLSLRQHLAGQSVK